VTAVDGAEKKRRDTLLGIAMVVVAACMWGSWPLLLRYADSKGAVPASVKTAIVMVTIALVSFAVVPFDRVKKKAAPREWMGVVWLGVGDALNAMCLFYAYKVASVAVAALTHDTGPLLVAVFAPLLLRERVRAATFAAIGLSLVGLALMLRPWEVSATRAELTGAGYGLLSAVFYASNVIMNKRLTGSFSGSELMAWHGLFALPVLLLVSGLSAWSEVKLAPVVVLAVAAIGPGAIGGLLFAWSVRRIDASLAATVALLEPIVAIILSVVLLGEKLTMLGGVGVGLVLAGAWLVVRPRRVTTLAADPS
jgi:drug/metabolite transporter (DMT)-like permease